MRRAPLLIFVIAILAGLSAFAQSVGGGAMGHGALGQGALGQGALGGAGAGAGAGEAGCLDGAILDYDTYNIATGAVSSLTNAGSGGSSWDLVQGVGADQPTATSNCGASSGNCIDFDSTDFLETSGTPSATWDEFFVCLHYEEDDDGQNNLFTWTPADTLNYVASSSSISQNYTIRGSTSNTNRSQVTAGWHVVCFDMTNQSSASMWKDGVLVETNMNLGTVTDPTGLAIARRGAAHADGIKLGRFVAWGGEHCTASEITDALNEQRGDYQAVLATAAFDYSAESLSQADGSSVTLVENLGEYEATWDLDTVTASGGTIVYQQAGDCVGSSKPCVEADNAMIQMGSSDASKSPTVDIQCLAFSTPASYPGARDVYGWGTITGSHNQVAAASATVDVFYDLGTQSQVTQTDGTLHVLCWDGTDPATLTVSLNGGTPAASTDSSGSGARDPEQIFFGGSSSGVDARGDHLFQAVGWSEDPGFTLAELSQMLYDYWSG